MRLPGARLSRLGRSLRLRSAAYPPRLAEALLPSMATVRLLGKGPQKKRLYQDGHMWCLLQCSVCSRELLRPHLCRHFLLAFPLHAPCLGCTRVLLLEGFCPKSAKRNGRGKERRGEGTEEARRRKGKEEREKRTGPTRVLIIPQMRCSQGTKLTHKAHFPPSGTRSSPRME